MKKILSIILIVAVIFALPICILAFSTDAPQKETYTIVVNGQIIDLSDLPVSPYKEGTTVMVPLRKIGEALGYKVDFDPKTNAITIDDEYIQKAILFDGTTTVVFEGRLKVINMSREIENQVPTVIHDGCAYVPLEFFAEFFNDTVIDGSNITIAPSKCELNTDME